MVLMKPERSAHFITHVVFVIICACCFAGVDGVRLQPATGAGQALVDICHLQNGTYRLVRRAGPAWAAHEKHLGDCCTDAAVCGARQCSAAWTIDAAAQTCTPPSCPTGSTWDAATLSCADAVKDAEPNPCQTVANSDGTRIGGPAPSTDLKCGCLPGFAWDAATPARPAACVACVSVVVGNGSRGYSGDGGLASDAQLYDPLDVSVDALGNVYIADCSNWAIRQVNASTGTITSLGGDHTPGGPFSVLAAADGNIYFTDDGGVLYMYSPETNKTTSYALNAPPEVYATCGLAIQPTSGLVHVVGQEASAVDVLSFNLSSPTSSSTATTIPNDGAFYMAFNASGDAFIPCYITGRINRWNGSAPPAPWNTGFDLPAPPVGTSVVFNQPAGIAFDSAGNMLVSENVGCRVWLVEASTGQLRLVAGTGTCGSNLNSSDPTTTQLDSPYGVAFGPGGRSVYIVDTLNERVVRIMLECVGA